MSNCNHYDETQHHEEQPFLGDIAASAEHPHRIGRYRIESVLGRGGFGLVYLAHDDQLDRLVAIKVPHLRLISNSDDAATYLTEARTVANLDHPRIVPVHDVGSTTEFPCYVVIKYIKGTDLATKLKQQRLKYREGAALVAIVADALHYAHKQGVVHRDVKPGNILIDKDGEPYVVDFGLALREEDFGKGPQCAGTPSYMSPEQARGEGHRVDGRSDIFSLGIVLYELLSGRKPFRGDSREELLEQVTSYEPRPLRQYDEKLPKELERICQKALSKRASDRYSSAYDMAEELRSFLAEQTAILSANSSGKEVPSNSDAAASQTASTSTLSNVDSPRSNSPCYSENQTGTVVPKGLRSFDSHDADFFLALLPGPVDREGLPACLRFWKTRIEDTDSDKTFSVGLIYGTSGCGKSSLVKAGLLPLLSKDIIPIYLEATPNDTETRLRHRLQNCCPTLDASMSLKDTFWALRLGKGIPDGRKVLIVLDQFEQWLHTNKENNTDLVQALRQCNGGRLQCIVIVRDDFWLAVSRLGLELEIDFVPGDNMVLIDLFDVDHSRKVLEVFGRGFGRLPVRTSETTKEQQVFLNKSITGLAENGKVIALRIALFAEMMRGRPWTDDSLREIGGVAGVGLNFLDETFLGKTVPPSHRLHRKAIESVLEALLPVRGSDIKGQLKSFEELMQASGYADRPTNFAAVLRILDSGTRLITPTETDESETEPARYYQLTHDFLVTPLREWLTRNRRQTWRGRCELLLEERTSLWSSRSETQQLPSLMECVAIRCNIRPSRWTPFQTSMMRVATRHYALRFALAMVVIAIAIFGVFEIRGRMKTNTLVASLLHAEPNGISNILNEIQPYRRWAIPRLQEMQLSSDAELFNRQVALFRLESSQSDKQERLTKLLTRSNSEQARVVASEILASSTHPEDALWEKMSRADSSTEILSTATVIAAIAPDDPQWEKVTRKIIEQLSIHQPDQAALWIDNLSPAGQHFLTQLEAIMTSGRQSDRDDSRRRYITALALAKFLQHKPDDLSRLLLLHARSASEFQSLLAPLRALGEQSVVHIQALDCSIEDKSGTESKSESQLPQSVVLASREARRTIAELLLGDPASLRRELKLHEDCTLRSVLIHQFEELGVPPMTLISLLNAEHDAEIRAALLQGIGGYSLDDLMEPLRAQIEVQVRKSWKSRNPEEHAAAKWLDDRWPISIIAQEVSESESGDRGWYTSSGGHELMILRDRLPYDFALSATEVTVAQYRHFNPDYDTGIPEGATQFLDSDRMSDCPVIYVSCFEAMQYCNWLSRQKGLPEHQLCYAEVGDGTFRLKDNHIRLNGFRLPEFSEWQLGCAVNMKTQFSFGDDPRLLPNYAWYFSNSRINGQHRARPVGQMKPNTLGLFDTYGNVWEWVTHSERPQWSVLCGGSCDNDPIDLQLFAREILRVAESREMRIGFRIAQTVPRQSVPPMTSPPKPN